jgi:hypothetical protein
METLRQKQSRFALSEARLVLRMFERGYEVTRGESWRTDEQAEINRLGPEGRRRVMDLLRPYFPKLCDALANNGRTVSQSSVHPLRLASDLNLFKDGMYLSSSEDHREFGLWWESLGPDYRWGGRWGDGNHYSIEHNGVK